MYPDDRQGETGRTRVGNPLPAHFELVHPAVRAVMERSVSRLFSKHYPMSSLSQLCHAQAENSRRRTRRPPTTIMSNGTPNTSGLKLHVQPF